MAKNEARRIRPQTLAEDLDAYAALQDMAAYAPANPSYTKDSVKGIYDAMIAKQHGEARSQAALDAARDDAVGAEWALHNAMLGVTDQVAAQFGTDSNEYQAMGRKKKSEYSRPKRTAKPGSTPARS